MSIVDTYAGERVTLQNLEDYRTTCVMVILGGFDLNKVAAEFHLHGMLVM